MKIPIQQVEDKIGLKIKRNCISFGFDTAEYCTGIVGIKTDDKDLEVIYQKIITVPKDKEMPITDKLSYFYNQLQMFKNDIKYTVDVGVVEDCFLQFNVWCLKILARFETLVWTVLANEMKWKYLFFKQARHARQRVKIDMPKKQTTKERKQFVKDWIKNNFGFEFTSEDLADGFVLGLCGIAEPVVKKAKKKGKK